MNNSENTPEDMVQLVRDAIASRDGMGEVEIRETQPGHVHVVVEQETVEGDSERVLYRIERVPQLDGEETLRWKELGFAE